MLEVKICPFCGYTPNDFITTQGEKWGAVVCGVCGCCGPEVRTGYHESNWHEDAVKKWNKRVIKP